MSGENSVLEGRRAREWNNYGFKHTYQTLAYRLKYWAESISDSINLKDIPEKSHHNRIGSINFFDFTKKTFNDKFKNCLITDPTEISAECGDERLHPKLKNTTSFEIIDVSDAKLKLILDTIHEETSLENIYEQIKDDFNPLLNDLEIQMESDDPLINIADISENVCDVKIPTNTQTIKFSLPGTSLTEKNDVVLLAKLSYQKFKLINEYLVSIGKPPIKEIIFTSHYGCGAAQKVAGDTHTETTPSIVTNYYSRVFAKLFLAEAKRNGNSDIIVGLQHISVEDMSGSPDFHNAMGLNIRLDDLFCGDEFNDITGVPMFDMTVLRPKAVKERVKLYFSIASGGHGFGDLFININHPFLINIIANGEKQNRMALDLVSEINSALDEINNEREENGILPVHFQTTIVSTTSPERNYGDSLICYPEEIRELQQVAA